MTTDLNSCVISTIIKQYYSGTSLSYRKTFMKVASSRVVNRWWYTAFPTKLIVIDSIKHCTSPRYFHTWHPMLLVAMVTWHPHRRVERDGHSPLLKSDSDQLWANRPHHSRKKITDTEQKGAIRPRRQWKHRGLIHTVPQSPENRGNHKTHPAFNRATNGELHI